MGRLEDLLMRAAVPKAGLGNLLVGPRSTGKKGGPKVATQNVSWQSPGQPQILDQDAQQFGEEAYLGQVYVQRCCQAISHTIATLPFRAGMDPTDPAAHDLTAPLVQLLGEATPQAPGGPNPKTASRAFWAWSIIQYLVYGRWAWEAQLAGPKKNGLVVGLWPLIAPHVSPIPSQGGEEYFDSFVYTTPQWGDMKMSRDEMIYAWRPSLIDWRLPETVLSAAKLPIYIAKGLDRYMVKLLQNDMVASTLVVTPPFDEASARRAWQEQFLTSFSGVDNRGKTIFAEAEYDEDDTSGKPLVQVEKIAQTAVDAQLLELSKTAKDEICLLPGSGIVTKRGVVPVEQVIVGDEVITHKGRWRKVLNTQVRPVHHPVVELRSNGLTPLRLTTNHNVFAAEYVKTHADTRQQFRGAGKVPAGDLRPRGRQRRQSHAMTIPKMEFNAETGILDMVAIQPEARKGSWATKTVDGMFGYDSTYGNDIPAQVKMTPALGRLLGLYLAEGSTSGHQVLWALHEDERELQQQIADDVMEVFGLPVEIVPVKGERCVYVRLSSTLVVPVFKSGTARTKVIPSWAWDGDEAFLREVLWGWIAGDGTDDGRNVRGFTSSESLAWGMRIIAIGFGHRAALQHIEKRLDSYIDGRLLRGGEAWQVLWQTDDREVSEGHGNIYRFESAEYGEALTSPLREVTDVAYDGLVYNFHVEEDTSYLTVGGAVANCVAMGVPLSLIGNAQERIYANAASEFKNFWTMTVINLITEIQDHVNTLLAPRLGQEVGWFDLSRVAALQPPQIFAPPMIGDVINYGIASAAQIANVLGIPAADATADSDTDTVELGEESAGVGPSGINRNHELYIHARAGAFPSWTGKGFQRRVLEREIRAARDWRGTRVTKGQLIDARIRFENRPINSFNWDEQFRACNYLKRDSITVHALETRSATVPELEVVTVEEVDEAVRSLEAESILSDVERLRARAKAEELEKRARETADLIQHTLDTAEGLRMIALGERIKKQLHARLKQHYPESTLKWVHDAQWDSPKQVNLADIDMKNRPGGRDPKKVTGLMKAMAMGRPEALAPVVLVDDGGEKLKVADGYHRLKAREKLGHVAINAYVGHVDAAPTKDEDKKPKADGNGHTAKTFKPKVAPNRPWESEMHDKKLNREQSWAIISRSSGNWHNSDGASPDGSAEELAAHLHSEHAMPELTSNWHDFSRDELDEMHARDHSQFGECGAHEKDSRTVAGDNSYLHLGKKDQLDGKKMLTKGQFDARFPNNDLDDYPFYVAGYKEDENQEDVVAGTPAERSQGAWLPIQPNQILHCAECGQPATGYTTDGGGKVTGWCSGHSDVETGADSVRHLEINGTPLGEWLAANELGLLALAEEEELADKQKSA